MWVEPHNGGRMAEYQNRATGKLNMFATGKMAYNMRFKNQNEFGKRPPSDRQYMKTNHEDQPQIITNLHDNIIKS